MGVECCKKKPGGGVESNTYVPHLYSKKNIKLKFSSSFQTSLNQCVPSVLLLHILISGSSLLFRNADPLCRSAGTKFLKDMRFW
jgi:hypothetical protein